MKLRRCKVCSRAKKLIDFGKHKGCQMDRLPTCKECRNLANKEERKTPEGQQKALLLAKINSVNYYLRRGFSLKEAERKFNDTKKQRKKFSRMSKEERENHRKEYRKKWHEKHKKELKIKRKEYFIKYRKEHSGYYSLACHKRRNRLYKAGSFTWADWLTLEKFVGYRCLSCNLSVTAENFPTTVAGNKKLTIDHVIPLHLGGSNYITNLQPLCWLCHRQKGQKATTDFRSPAILEFLYRLQNFSSCAQE